MSKKSFVLQSQGFTLIELIVVFSIMAILAVVGIASFVSYSRSQALTTTVADIKTILGSARSYTASQVSTQCPSGQFGGYQVRFCTTYVSNTKQVCGQCSVNTDYELDPICNGAVTFPSLQKKQLPPNVRVYGNQCQSVLFNPISSSVTGATTLTVEYNVPGYVKSNTILISASGDIQ